MSERLVNLLRELRYVSTETGYQAAWRMSIEWRRWWISEMQKEAQQRQGNGSEAEQRQEVYRKTAGR